MKFACATETAPLLGIVLVTAGNTPNGQDTTKLQDPSPAPVEVPRGWRRLRAPLRALVCALVAPAPLSPCPHRDDGTMCEECAWHWAIR